MFLYKNGMALRFPFDQKAVFTCHGLYRFKKKIKMKTCIPLLVLSLLLSGYATRNEGIPTPPIETIFESTFPQATAVQWKKEGTLYYVYCKVNNLPVRISYTEQGQMETCLRYYGAEELPPYIRARLAKRFTGASITGVTEFYNAESLSFTINLKKGTQLILLETNALGESLAITYLKDKTAPNPSDVH